MNDIEILQANLLEIQNPLYCTRKELYDAVDHAIEALREKAEQENPKPLTLDELREMDGEPVWIVENGETKCGVVNLEGNCFEKEPVITLANGNFYLLKEYNGKTWPAYRTRPEGSGE